MRSVADSLHSVIMDSGTIRRYLNTTPFKPFSVVTSDGKSIRIVHPDYAFLTQGGVTLLINTEGDKVDDLYVPLIPRASS